MTELGMSEFMLGLVVNLIDSSKNQLWKARIQAQVCIQDSIELCCKCGEIFSPEWQGSIRLG